MVWNKKKYVGTKLLGSWEELVFQSDVKVIGLDQSQHKSSTNNYNRLEDRHYDKFG